MDSKRKDRPGDAAMNEEGRVGSIEESSAVKKRVRPGQCEEGGGDRILLNGKLVPRPNCPTSYGILFYKQEDTSEIRYLLGLIPQGNAWTVFKGLPETDELPQETAVREFQEETSLTFPYPEWENCPIKTKLYGITSKKLLEIYLISAPLSSSSSSPGSELDISRFNVDKVVKIDSGYMAGKPEIVEIRYLSMKQAIEGVPGRGMSKVAKIYKSQVGILEQAETILKRQLHSKLTAQTVA
jgi:8-oxo-dGTP pyrophosphatase MutT (NUDIX family)